MPGLDQARRAIEELRDPRTIRARCRALLALARAGRSRWFLVVDARLPRVADRVVAVTRQRYPSLAIPVHGRYRHFEAGGVDRLAVLRDQLPGRPRDRARALVDLVVTSVLLDAGAGDAWRYEEPPDLGGGGVHARSEGLAVASLHLFRAGLLSGDPGDPLRADARGLRALTPERLGAALQVGPDNPLVGLEGRAGLLNRLGDVLAARPDLFGASARVGNLVDTLRARSPIGCVPAREVLALLLDGLGPIWPGRVTLGEVNLGDVWRHPLAGGQGATAGLVPFHKLSSWLSYSLVEPLAEADLTVTDLEALTGLAEYRNGGLLLDDGALVLRDPELALRPHAPDSELIVEWRALTVALLDELVPLCRARLGRGAARLPLANLLEGGTWAAGREAARERRPGGGPPLTLASDGTVF